MAKAKQNNQTQTRKPSKRQRRNKIIVYLMIAAMVGSVFTTGLAYVL
ncbi:Protein of unknown function [Pelagirhabdus alkalitolerans]|uniref:DUF4044 domain-containing protein n=1 Tax=Pelagirhabdus alkalitolerans TaxID=1612202 RepID=A0A1G6HCC0_9BACI|nr:stressosome-associated protein Prli42 [Pelagirhabdus alkalitolerans]SDB91922.1 Protein of unknown function [Pelagirhabdus alkalitolerans]